MNPTNAHSAPPEPLTPEERALAARLAQLGPHGMPAPALDASIIAAAHAVGDRQARPRHRRWPALLGLAATLALAIGVTWQMQPGVEVATGDGTRRERASAVAIDAPADRAEPAVPAGKQQPLARSEEAAPMRMPGPAAAEPDQAAVAGSQRARAAASAAPASPPQPQSALIAAPPAPPVGQQAIDAATPAQARRGATTGRMPESHSETPAAPVERAMADSSVAAVAGDDLAAVPVARDGELAPVAWIERIRQRRDAGDLAGARDSLALLRRAHPQAVLPVDLHNLAANRPDPP